MKRKKSVKTKKIKKVKKIKSPTHSQMKEVVTDIFHTYIKYRDGWVCVQCGAKDKITAGHVIPKAVGESMRFNDKNTFAQCSPCNYRHSLPTRTYLYHRWYIAVHGQKAFDELCEQANVVTKISTAELERLFWHYDSELIKLGVDYAVYADEHPYIKTKLNKYYPKFYH